MGFGRNAFFKGLYLLGLGRRMLRINQKKGLVPILVFHRIIPEFDHVWPGMHPKLFEEIIVMLKKHYTILPLANLISTSTAQMKKACFITFDDGYTDYLDYAYPILKKYHVPSGLFVIPYDISNSGYIWTSKIIFFVKRYWFEEVYDFFKSFGLNIKYTDKNSLFRINLDITKCLCKLKAKDRQPILNALLKKITEDNKSIDNELMSFEQLAKLDKNLAHIGSHSLSHPSFSEEDDLNLIEHEIASSKEVIEKAVGIKVESFAFPFAKFNDLSLNVVKKYYKLCFTRIDDHVDLNKLKNDKNYIYDLPRFNVYQDSAEEVFFLINGFHKKFKS